MTSEHFTKLTAAITALTETLLPVVRQLELIRNELEWANVHHGPRYMLPEADSQEQPQEEPCV